MAETDPIRLWQEQVRKLLAAGEAMSDQSALARQLFEPMQRQAELFQAAIEQQAGAQGDMVRTIVEPLVAQAELLTGVVEPLRRQAELFEGVAESLSQAARLMRSQAELFAKATEPVRGQADLLRRLAPRQPD